MLLAAVVLADPCEPEPAAAGLPVGAGSWGAGLPGARRFRAGTRIDSRAGTWIGRRDGTRIVLGLAALVALWAIAVPLSTTIEVRQSQAAVLRGQFRTALADAATAQRLEPAAASPRLQRALILEQLGDIAGADQAIAQAASREPTNWQIWLVASRMATESDQPGLALADYRRARALNPTSPIFHGSSAQR